MNMKTKAAAFLLLITMLGLTDHTFGQRFHGGVMVGLAATQLDGDNLGGYNKPGVRFGGWVNTHIKPNMILQLELEYIQKGSKISDAELEQQKYYHCRLNYIQVPLLAKTTLMPRLEGEAGIAASYLTRSLEDKDGGGFLQANPDFTQFELSGLVSLGYQLLENLTVNVRFNYSLLPVREHPGDQTYWLDRGQFNNAMLFSLYYQID
jgi:hypothetical protein